MTAGDIGRQMTNNTRPVGLDLEELVKLGVLNESGGNQWFGIDIWNYSLTDKETFTSALPTWISSGSVTPRQSGRFPGTALASKLLTPTNMGLSPYEIIGSRQQLIDLTNGSIGGNSVDFQFGGANNNKGTNHPTSGDFSWIVELPPLGIWESESALKLFETGFKALTKAIAVAQSIPQDVIDGDLTSLWNTVVDSANGLHSLFSDPANVDNLINLLTDVRKMVPPEIATYTFTITQTAEQMSRNRFINTFTFKTQTLNIAANPFPMPPPLAVLDEIADAAVAVVRVVLKVIGQILRLEFGQLVIDLLGTSDDWFAIARFLEHEII
jgi:hypothetical protein